MHRTPNLNELLKVIIEAKIEFVLIGGFAGVLHGSSMVTQDLDIAMIMEAENLERLRSALKNFNPQHRRTRPPLSFNEVPTTWDGIKNLYLKTDLGVLDVLGELPPLGELKDIFNRSEKIRVFGYEIKVLSIDDLITTKKALGREKDLLMIKELEKIKS